MTKHTLLFIIHMNYRYIHWNPGHPCGTAHGRGQGSDAGRRQEPAVQGNVLKYLKTSFLFTAAIDSTVLIN